MNEIVCRKTAILLFFVAATVIVCEGKLTLECAKKYLKYKNVHEDALSFVNDYAGSLTDCESDVKSTLTTSTSNLRNKLSGNRQQRPFVECVMQDIEEEYDESYDLLVLQQTAIDMVSGWRFWSYWNRNSRLDELKAASQKIVDKSLTKCRANRDFGDVYSNLQEKSSSLDRSGEEEYCIRNHLKMKLLLKLEVYGFQLNPRNVQTQGLICEPVVAGVSNIIYDEIKSSKGACFEKVYREKSYADYILKAEILSKLTLGRSDKSREKQDFINAMIDISYEAQKC